MPISDILLELRNDLVQGGKTPFLERVAMKAMALGMTHPWMYKLAQRFMPWILKPVSKNGWVKFLPGPSGGWTKVKDLPLPARKSFLRSLGEKK
jgi:L-lactate utilization protein LutB